MTLRGGSTSFSGLKSGVQVMPTPALSWPFGFCLSFTTPVLTTSTYAAWEMTKEQFTAFCLSLLPWLGPLVYRDGVTPPLNPGRPPERAGESTRTPLISTEKLALPRPARGAPLASSLTGFFRETGGQWGPHPRTSPCAPVWPTASAYGFFASEKSKP